MYIRSKVGIYRLTMKTGSYNFRQLAIQDVINQMYEAGVEDVIHEPVLEENEFDGLEGMDQLLLMWIKILAGIGPKDGIASSIIWM